jgi:pentatricopeptide repeat domain-containing protein 1
MESHHNKGSESPSNFDNSPMSWAKVLTGGSTEQRRSNRSGSNADDRGRRQPSITEDVRSSRKGSTAEERSGRSSSIADYADVKLTPSEQAKTAAKVRSSNESMRSNRDDSFAPVTLGKDASVFNLFHLRAPTEEELSLCKGSPVERVVTLDMIPPEITKQKLEAALKGDLLTCLLSFQAFVTFNPVSDRVKCAVMLYPSDASVLLDAAASRGALKPLFSLLDESSRSIGVKFIAQQSSRSNFDAELLWKLAETNDWKVVASAVAELKEHSTTAHYNVCMYSLKRARLVGECCQLFREMKALPRTAPNADTYHLLISALGQNNRLPVMARYLDEFFLAPLQHDSKTICVALQALGKSHYWERSLDLIERARSLGIEFDSTVYSQVINALEKSGKVDLAAKVFDDMASRGITPDINCFVIMIYACSGPNAMERAHGLLDLMKKQNLEADESVYVAMIAVCGRNKQWQKALDFFCAISSAGITPDINSYCSAMLACSKSGQVDEVRRIFNELRSKHLPTTSAYNILIAAMEHVPDCVPEIEDILREMKSSGIPIDSSTYSAAIFTCARCGHFDVVLSLLDRASWASIEIPLSSFHTILSILEKSGQFQNAIDLLQRLKESSNVQPTLVTYTSVITCCARVGQWAKALELLNESTFRGFELTSTVFNACISACEKGRQLEKAVEVLRQMDALRIPANAVTYNSIISACEKVGAKSDIVNAFLDEMSSRQIDPDVITFNAAISAYGKAGDWKRANSAFRLMEKMSIKPDVITYNSLINAAGKAEQWEQACSLLGEMRQNGIEPDVISYSAAISACEKGGGQWVWAVGLLSEMREANIQPDVIAYSATISACEKGGQWERAIEILAEMRARGVEPNMISYNAAISACGACQQYQKAIELLHDMRTHKLEPDVASYGVVISACDKCDQYEAVISLIEEMIQQKMQPESSSLIRYLEALVATQKLDFALSQLQSPLFADRVLNAIQLGGTVSHLLQLFSKPSQHPVPLSTTLKFVDEIFRRSYSIDYPTVTLLVSTCVDAEISPILAALGDSQPNTDDICQKIISNAIVVKALEYLPRVVPSAIHHSLFPQPSDDQEEFVTISSKKDKKSKNRSLRGASSRGKSDCFDDGESKLPSTLEIKTLAPQIAVVTVLQWLLSGTLSQAGIRASIDEGLSKACLILFDCLKSLASVVHVFLLLHSFVL